MISKFSFSVMQTAIAAKVANGKSRKQIGGDLGISLKTVDKHLAAIRVKTKTDNIHHLSAVLARNGW